MSKRSGHKGQDSPTVAIFAGEIVRGGFHLYLFIILQPLAQRRFVLVCLLSSPSGTTRDPGVILFVLEPWLSRFYRLYFFGLRFLFAIAISCHSCARQTAIIGQLGMIMERTRIFRRAAGKEDGNAELPTLHKPGSTKSPGSCAQKRQLAGRADERIAPASPKPALTCCAGRPDGLQEHALPQTLRISGVQSVVFRTSIQHSGISIQPVFFFWTTPGAAWRNYGTLNA